MREIKFRAWDKKSKKYRNLDFVSFGGEGCFDTCDQLPKVYGLWGRDCIEEKPMICHRERGEVELEQFTGLDDKNGKEIYEGDIIMMDEEAVVSPNEAVVIAYDFGVPLSHPVDSRFYNTNCIHELCVDRLGNSKPRHGVAGIVIGNIHENPELLNAH